MSRSKKGKKASRKLAVESLKKLIQSKFENCSFDDKKTLFVDLEKWAKENLGSEQCELFLEALYNVDCSYDIQITLGVERALDKIAKGDK